MKVLGVVTARGGSKGIPNKNLAMMRGRSLLWYTAHVALRAKLRRVVISTDCPEIARHARELGIEVPFMRPAELATDDAKSIDVLKHAAEQCPGFDAVFCLQPTNPLRSVEDIDGAIQLMEETGCDSVIGYSEVGERHPVRMSYRHGNSVVPLLYGSDTFARRQQLPPVLLRNGAVYLTKTEWILRGSITGNDSRPWIIPPERAVNVDEPIDLRICEAIMGEA